MKPCQRHLLCLRVVKSDLENAKNRIRNFQETWNYPCVVTGSVLSLDKKHGLSEPVENILQNFEKIFSNIIDDLEKKGLVSEIDRFHTMYEQVVAVADEAHSTESFISEKLPGKIKEYGDYVFNQLSKKFTLDKYSEASESASGNVVYGYFITGEMDNLSGGKIPVFICIFASVDNEGTLSPIHIGASIKKQPSKSYKANPVNSKEDVLTKLWTCLDQYEIYPETEPMPEINKEYLDRTYDKVEITPNEIKLFINGKNTDAVRMEEGELIIDKEVIKKALDDINKATGTKDKFRHFTQTIGEKILITFQLKTFYKLEKEKNKMQDKTVAETT